MAKRGSDAVDGFAYVQAVKRASARSATPSKPKVHDSTGREMPAGFAAGSSAPTGAEAAPSPMRTGGRVAVPVKRLVICYVCGYSHTLSGRMHHSFCPKCRTQLETDDRTVSGECVTDVQTIGDVRIEADVVFAPGLRVTGRRIVLDGDATPLASITAMDALEIWSHARFGGVAFVNPSGRVVIPAGVRVELETGLTCGELDIEGHVKGSVSVTVRARIHPGGLLEGAYAGPSLIVEAGGGLLASVNLNPAPAGNPSVTGV